MDVDANNDFSVTSDECTINTSFLEQEESKVETATDEEDDAAFPSDNDVLVITQEDLEEVPDDASATTQQSAHQNDAYSEVLSENDDSDKTESKVANLINDDFTCTKGGQ